MLCGAAAAFVVGRRYFLNILNRMSKSLAYWAEVVKVN